VKAVRSDDHAGALGDGLASLAVASDADSTAALDDDLLDGESLADFGSCLGRRVHEQPVEHGASRSVRNQGVFNTGGARERERSEVERIDVDGRTSGLDQPTEQAPSAERRHARGMNEMSRNRVTREGRAIDDEDLVALAG
jgi:hypothetical protein